MSNIKVRKLPSSLDLYEVKWTEGNTELKRRLYVKNDTLKFDYEEELESQLKICIETLKEIQADTSYKWHNRLAQIDKIKQHVDKALKKVT